MNCREKHLQFLCFDHTSQKWPYGSDNILRKKSHKVESTPPPGFKKQFLKIFEICTFDTSNFFEKFPEKLWNFFNFSKSKKTTIFGPKLVQNHYMDQNVAKFSPKTTKKANFSLKLIFFQNFGRFRRPKFVLLILKKGTPVANFFHHFCTTNLFFLYLYYSYIGWEGARSGHFWKFNFWTPKLICKLIFST